MKRIALIVLIGLLWGCSASVMDWIEEPSVSQPEVDDFDLIIEEPVDYNDLEVTEKEIEFEEVKEHTDDNLVVLSGMLPVSLCRLENRVPGRNVMAGFPFSPYRLPSSGILNVQVIFVDFPDYEGVLSDLELLEFFESYIQGIIEFYEFQSFGRLQFSFSVHPDFVRVPFPTSELSLNRSNQRDLDYVLRESIRLADPHVDYSDVDMVIVFMNPDIPEEVANVSPAWPMNGNQGFRTREGTFYNATLIAADAVRIGYPIIAHEIGHLLGLVDLYNFNWLANNPERDWLRQFDFVGVFDFMNWADPNQYGDNRDMLSWQRYLLDWITDEQVRCVDPKTPFITTHELIASHLNEQAYKVIVVPFDRQRALVVEVKSENQYCSACSGGVYTYVVDLNYENGFGPIRMIRPDHSSHPLFLDAYLREGQMLTYENVTIEVLSEQTSTVIQVKIE